MTPWTYGAGLAVWIMAAVGLYGLYRLGCLAIWQIRYRRDMKRRLKEK
jgi:hypothetical protein